MPPTDPPFEEIGAGAVELHLRVVIAFDRQHVQIDKPLDEFTRHPAQIGCVADPAIKAFDEKPCEPSLSWASSIGCINIPETGSKD